jgi:broad specificity phosphatase PhoE
MKTIFVIRHAEKPAGKIKGIDPNGNADKDSLIVRGWERAGALADFFGSKDGLPAPDRIFASAAQKKATRSAKTRRKKARPAAKKGSKTGSKSKRPTQTVMALAAKLGQRVSGKYTKGEEANLVKAVTALDGKTLVCWQHEAIPKIAGLIVGSMKGIPKRWPSRRFDVVWQFTSSKSKWKFDQVCQLVLAGDSAKAIKRQRSAGRSRRR